MQVQLRLVTLLFLFVSLPALGAAGMWFVSERKLQRIREERAIYAELANKAVEMSDKAMMFAYGYQQVLDTCMVRLYAQPLSVENVASNKGKPRKGGLGGPDPVRGSSRLP